MAESDAFIIKKIMADLEDGNIDHAAATDRLFSVVYAELHHLAKHLMRNERANHTLQTTALIHEAYVKLMQGEVPGWQSRGHFFGVAARAMRQILVDHARTKNAAKRGGGWQRVTLTDELELSKPLNEQIIELDTALTQLAVDNPRMAKVAELTIFCGFKTKELADVLGVSLRTVQDDWRVARMWLSRELSLDGAT